MTPLQRPKQWEGKVIDTTNFSPKSDFMGSHEHLRLTERLTRVGPDTLDYEFTISDPTTWTAPWTAMVPLKLKDGLILTARRTELKAPRRSG